MATHGSARQPLRGRSNGVGCQQRHQTSGAGIETAGSASPAPALHGLATAPPATNANVARLSRLLPVPFDRSTSGDRQAIRPAAYVQTVRRDDGRYDNRSGIRRLSFLSPVSTASAMETE